MNIQDYSIIIESASQEELNIVKQILIDNGQEILDGSVAFHPKSTYTCIIYSTSNNWCGGSTESLHSKQLVSPAEFISLFGKKNIRDYLIILENTTLKERASLIEVLKKAGEKIYPHTIATEVRGFSSAAHFGYDTSAGNWSICTPDKRPQITIVEAIQILGGTQMIGLDVSMEELRKYAIEVGNTPLDLRLELRDKLAAIGEPLDYSEMVKDTCILACLYFSDGIWHTPSTTTGNPQISIENFLKLLDAIPAPSFIHGNIENAIPGDIVEFNYPGYSGSFTHGKLYIVGSFEGRDIHTTYDDKGSTTNGFSKVHFKLIPTTPNVKAKVGQKVICTDKWASVNKVGEIYTVQETRRSGTVRLQGSNGSWLRPEDYRILPENYGEVMESTAIDEGVEESVIVDTTPVIWENQKPAKPYTKEFTIGDTIVIHGVAPIQVVEKITPKQLRIVGSKKAYPKELARHVYKKTSLDVAVGDIMVSNDIYHIATGHTQDEYISTTKGNLTVPKSSVTALYSLTQETLVIQEYSCGSLKYDGFDYGSLEQVQIKYPDAKIKTTKLPVNLEHTKIAEHFNIPIESVRPKELSISQKLERALDHPLNIEVKEWALVYGPSGSGKTSACIDYANKKQREYVKMQGSAQLTVDDFLGFKSITTGDYFPSLLRDAVETGKTFILDEIDSCNPNTLLVLNGLKQEKYQFPDALIKIHEDFRLIATANTLEYSEQYNARQPMDKATLARFDKIEYTMEPHELALRYGLKYMVKIDKPNTLTPREVARKVIKLKIEEITDVKF